MNDLLIATATVVGVLMVAGWVFRVVSSLVDHTDPGRGWGATFDEFYSHPHPHSGPAARERPGPGQIPRRT